MQQKYTYETILEEFEKLFPKGKCRERGAALVLLAYFKMFLDGKTEKEKTDEEKLLDCLRYCRHRVSEKHPISGLHKTGITKNDIKRLINKFENSNKDLSRCYNKNLKLQTEYDKIKPVE